MSAHKQWIHRVSGQTVLVVDDNVANLRFTSRLLQEAGCRVLTARDGKSAIERVRHGRPDLILLDVMMPKMDGLDTCRHLKADPDLQHIPVIFMTALMRSDEKDKCFELGAVDYITKPFQTKELVTGRRVLVVEDSELNRDVAKALLQDVGVVVEMAENGRMAVDKITGAADGWCDVVLMDIKMPIMDGYEATRHIREYEQNLHDATFRAGTDKFTAESTSSRPAAPRVPIIALTAHSLSGEKEKCLAAGMDDFLAKPINLESLEQMLLKWIKFRTGSRDLDKPPHVKTDPNGSSLLDFESGPAQLGVSKTIYVNILKKFKFEWSRTNISNISDFFAGNSQADARLLHKVKGTAATIGAFELAAVAEKLETAVLNHQYEGELEIQFKAALNRALSSVDAYLTTQEDSGNQTQSIHPGNLQAEPGVVRPDIDLRDGLERLSGYLGEGNLQAMNLWEQLKPLIAEGADGTQVADFEQKLHRLEFAKAGSLLKQLMNRGKGERE